MAVLSKAVALLSLAGGLAFGAPEQSAPDELVTPKATDEFITTFTSPHEVYFPAGKPRGELLLFLPGLYEKEGLNPGAECFCRIAAQLGYHAFLLSYPNKRSVTEACREATSPSAFEDFRWPIIQGGATLSIEIAKPESIENRTIKLLQFLHRKYPAQGWAQFLRHDEIVWDKVAVAGHSQGGGHAALIATRHYVARAICLSAPRDYNVRLDAPAAWYKNSLTLPKRFFTFNNIHDRQGCSTEQTLLNIRSLELDLLGDMVDVDQEAAPYRHAHVLWTHWPGPRTNSLTAHISVLHDRVRGPDGSLLFQPVWRYMLTEPTN